MIRFAVVLCAVVAAAAAEHDPLSGMWQGEYYYPDGRGPVPFALVLGDDGGRLSGRLIEPNTFANADAVALSATIDGESTERTLRFTKTYDGAGGAAHGVEYTGVVTGDRREAIGTWTLGARTGYFRLRRAALDVPMAWAPTATAQPPGGAATPKSVPAPRGDGTPSAHPATGDAKGDDGF